MKIIKYSFAILCSLAFMSFVQVLQKEWKILNDEYSIKFSTEKASGTISGLTGKLLFDPNNVGTSSMHVQVDVNTIDLGFFLKTRHAKAEDFLNTERYPTISFDSKKIVKQGNHYLVDGDLKIKNISKAVSIPFEFQKSDNKQAFVGEFSINRSEFDLKDKKGVGEKIKIELRVPVYQ